MTAEKILGCLIGAASGDAMGAATECRSSAQIFSYFGDYVTTFLDPPPDTFGRFNKAGMCTDDFLQALYICQELCAEGGLVSENAMERAFARWLAHPLCRYFTGPTTRAALAARFPKLAQQFLPSSSENSEFAIVNGANSKASNGGAMKIWPAALLHPGEPDRAIDSACSITRYTHNNTIAISAATAVAAAVAEALSEHSSWAAVLAAGVYGAERGAQLAARRGATTVDGASVGARIQLAVQLGQREQDWRSLVSSRRLTDLIGNGLAANEAVPMAFGLVAACAQQPLDAIFAAVNIGNDTDTIATMVGAIVGAFHGAACFPSDYLPTLERANDFKLTQLRDSILALRHE